MVECTVYHRDDSNSRGYSKLTVLRTESDNMIDGVEKLHRVLERAVNTSEDSPEIVRLVINLLEPDDADED